MSDVAHVPAQRIQLEDGHSLDDVFASAIKRGGDRAAPPASKPLARNEVRSPEELQAVINEAGIRYEECGQLSVSLNWWNRTSGDSSWQVGKPGGNVAS
jgi:hypothetical protein